LDLPSPLLKEGRFFFFSCSLFLLPPFNEGWGEFYNFISSSLLREVGKDFLVFSSPLGRAGRDFKCHLKTSLPS